MSKDTVLVYRCEVIGDRLSGGYRSVTTQNEYVKLSTNWERLPCPQEDGIPEMNRGEWWCGCKSITQFFKWWNKSELKHHSKTRNRLAILEVPKSEVRYGNHQVIFNRRKAKIVGKINEKGEAIFNSNYLRQAGQST